MPSKNLELEQALFLWYNSHETQSSPISGEDLTAKAKELAARPSWKSPRASNAAALRPYELSVMTGSIYWSLRGLCTRSSRCNEICKTIVSIRYIDSHLV